MLRVALLCLLFLPFCLPSVASASIASDIKACASIEGDEQRLDCYDQIARQHADSPAEVAEPRQLTDDVGRKKTVKEIEQELGADWLIYQDLEDLIEACNAGNEQISRFDTSCFSGEYVTGVKQGYLERLQEHRSDSARIKRRIEQSVQLAG